MHLSSHLHPKTVCQSGARHFSTHIRSAHPYTVINL